MEWDFHMFTDAQLDRDIHDTQRLLAVIKTADETALNHQLTQLYDERLRALKDEQSRRLNQTDGD
jgi:hypothetical protein